MGIMGSPGPQNDNIKLEFYLTVVEQAIHAHNSTPFLSQENFELLTPNHFLTPWFTNQTSIRVLPESSLPEIKKARYELVHLSWKINEVLKEEICLDLEKWRSDRLKLSKNKRVETVKLGDMVMIRRTNKHKVPQFGLVTSMEDQGRNSGVQLRSGYWLLTSVANLIPIGSGPVVSDKASGEVNSALVNNMELGQPNLGAEFSHFVSLSIGEKTSR